MEKQFSPTFQAIVGIIELLAETIKKIDEVYNDANKEVEKIWRRH